MARSQDYRTAEHPRLSSKHVCCLYAHHFIPICHEGSHLCLEMHLSATPYYSIAHVLYYGRQLVCTNMRMGIRKNRYRSAMLAEDIQYLVNGTALLAARV